MAPHAPTRSTIPQTIGLWDGAFLEPIARAKVYRVQENRQSFPGSVVLAGDRMLKQFALDVLGQITPNCLDRLSKHQQAMPLSTSPVYSSGRLTASTASMISGGSALIHSEAAAIKNSGDTPGPSSFSARRNARSSCR
jgi:hypothetical protein